MEFYVGGELLGGFFFDFLMGGHGTGVVREAGGKGNLTDYEMVMFYFVWGAVAVSLCRVWLDRGHDRS